MILVSPTGVEGRRLRPKCLTKCLVSLREEGSDEIRISHKCRISLQRGRVSFAKLDTHFKWAVDGGGRVKVFDPNLLSRDIWLTHLLRFHILRNAGQNNKIINWKYKFVLSLLTCRKSILLWVNIDIHTYLGY